MKSYYDPTIVLRVSAAIYTKAGKRQIFTDWAKIMLVSPKCAKEVGQKIIFSSLRIELQEYACQVLGCASIWFPR